MDKRFVDIGDDAELARQIRDALTFLYDHAHLQRHPLAECLVPSQAVAARTRAQELRRILLDAIEALNPGDSVPIRAVERRPYAILFGLYVEGHTWQEVAASLGIGGRQLRRDRAVALEALASILRDRYLTAPTGGASPMEEEPLRLEGERLAQEREPVDLSELVGELLPVLNGLASEQGVRLLSHVGSDLPRPNTNRTLMRQILISLASHALTTLPLVRLSFEAQLLGTMIGVGLRLEYHDEHLQTEGGLATLELKPVETLAAALRSHILKEPLASGTEKIWVLFPLREETVVLVVDDNQELFALFQRYAAGQPYRLVHAACADEALTLVQSISPDIITLDLMMPHRDGWELLRALRSDPSTANIPVIVCSVIEEPELALSLGAQMCLKKPIEQVDLLQALREAKTLTWEGEARRGSLVRSSALQSR